MTCGRSVENVQMGRLASSQHPKSHSRTVAVQEGSAVENLPSVDPVALRKESYDLAEMLLEVTRGNLHAEQDTGWAEGNDGW